MAAFIFLSANQITALFRLFLAEKSGTVCSRITGTVYSEISGMVYSEISGTVCPK